MSKKSASTKSASVKKEVTSAAGTSNPYAEEFLALKNRERHFDDLLTSEQFEGAELDEKLSKLYEKTSVLCNKYAWAVPDDRALSILQNFGPIIEIGAGRGYWASLLRNRGVDIVAFDKFCFSAAPATKDANKKKKGKSQPEGVTDTFTEVRKGGPEVLKRAEHRNRNLFLCYPDEAESMAADCLEYFLEHSEAEYIIHVGELISTGTVLGPPAAPFGRTSSADFQVSLAETFHCILVAELKHRYPISRDCISVWKRTNYVAGSDVAAVTGAGVLGESDEEEEEEEDEEEEEEEVPRGKKGNKRGRPEEDEKPGKKSKNSAPASDAVEYVRMEDLSKLREAALDMQYAEDQESRWAVIPDSERFPIDRAAPCVAHLL